MIDREILKLGKAVEAVLDYETQENSFLQFKSKWSVTTPICEFAIRVNTIHDGVLGYGSYSPFSIPMLWPEECASVVNIQPKKNLADLSSTRAIAAIDIGFRNAMLKKNIEKMSRYTLKFVKSTILEIDSLEWLLMDYDVSDIIDSQQSRGMLWDIPFEIAITRANIVARFVGEDIIKAIDSGELERIQRGHAILKPFLYTKPVFTPTLPRLQEFLDENAPMSKVHGAVHWMRVARFGDLLARYQSARYGINVDAEVVQWFAFIHDCRRKNDEYDTKHGPAAAEYVDVLRSTYLRDLSDEQVAKLKQACRLHTTSHRTGDHTIDTCFDSDRLDLTRVGIIPDPKKMATEAGAYIARCVDMKRI